MSGARRKRGRIWAPGDHPPPDPSTTVSVRHAASGPDAGMVSVVDALRSTGATTIEFGTDVRCVWWVRVAYPDGRVCEGRSAPTADASLGVLQAGAHVLREATP